MIEQDDFELALALSASLVSNPYIQTEEEKKREEERKRQEEEDRKMALALQSQFEEQSSGMNEFEEIPEINSTLINLDELLAAQIQIQNSSSPSPTPSFTPLHPTYRNRTNSFGSNRFFPNTMNPPTSSLLFSPPPPNSGIAHLTPSVSHHLTPTATPTLFDELFHGLVTHRPLRREFVPSPIRTNESSSYEALLELSERLGVQSVGLNAEELSSLEQTPFSGKEESVCQVCQSTTSPREPVIYLPCFHFYHADCITQWLERKNSCPICNCQVVKKN